jgi:glutaredoxin 3
VEGDRATAIALAKRTGRRTVPQIYIGEKHIGGFDDLDRLERESGLDALLNPSSVF